MNIRMCTRIGRVLSTAVRVNRQFCSRGGSVQLIRPAAARQGLNLAFPRFASTKVDSMLADFLKDEIEAEKKLASEQLPNGIVPSIPGFQIAANDDEVTLTKKLGKETIVVKFHVSNSVDTSMESEVPEEKPEQAPVVVSKPNFTVSIVKESQQLVFECEFIEPFGDEAAGDQPADDITDMFNIEEIYIHDGSPNERTYSVRGEIIDGGLYDHLMTYLEERGIDNAFAEHLIRFATHYEHAQYVALLQGIRDFVGR